MNLIGLIRASGLVGAVLFLVSCGGGGDVAGDSKTFAVAPKSYKLTLADGAACSSASEAPPVVVTIIGGQPPYRIINSAPELVIVDKTEATGKDPQFRVSYYQNAVLCASPASVTVLDYHSQATTFEYSVEASSN